MHHHAHGIPHQQQVYAGLIDLHSGRVSCGFSEGTSLGVQMQVVQTDVCW